MLSSFTTIIIAIIGRAYYIYNIVSAMDIFIPRTLTIRFFLFVLNVCLLVFSSLYFHIFSVILLLLMITYVLWEKERFMCASVWQSSDKISCCEMVKRLEKCAETTFSDLLADREKRVCVCLCVCIAIQAFILSIIQRD